MKFFLQLSLLLTLLVFLACAQSGTEQTLHEEPFDHGDLLIQPDRNQPAHYPHRRQKRATCDLLSALNINHTACAAYCITQGYRGGYCNSQAVCNCRR